MVTTFGIDDHEYRMMITHGGVALTRGRDCGAQIDTSTLAPISNIESLDFCAISESESNVVPFKFVCEHTL